LLFDAPPADNPCREIDRHANPVAKIPEAQSNAGYLRRPIDGYQERDLTPTDAQAVSTSIAITAPADQPATAIAPG